MNKKTSLLTGAFVAGTIALGALTGCESPVGPDKTDPITPRDTIPSVVKPDTTPTVIKPDTTPTVAKWKPLTQVYIKEEYDRTKDITRGSILGWVTAYSEDGTWNSKMPGGYTELYLQFGSVRTEVDEKAERFLCNNGSSFVANNILYYTDGSKGCRPVPENELDI